jgi:hypothetical protein
MKINPYQTILVMVTGFLVLGYFFPFSRKYFYYAALIVGISGLASSITRDWIVWIWEKFSYALGWFNSKILLSIVFILLLTPIAFLYRLVKGDILRIHKKPDKSAFDERNHTFSSIDLENPW